MRKKRLLIFTLRTANFDKITGCSFNTHRYTISTFFARIPRLCCVAFLQTLQRYRDVVFLEILAPVRLKPEIAFLENRPCDPKPVCLPRAWVRCLDPRDSGPRLPALLYWSTFCSVDLLHFGQNRFIVLGIFITGGHTKALLKLLEQNRINQKRKSGQISECRAK